MQADWAAAVAKRKRCGRGKSGLRRAVCRITSGTWASKPRDGQCHRKQTARTPRGVRVRVKRCGKSAPLRRQRRRHGKPHTEQDQIGNESGSNAGTRRPGAAASKRRPGNRPKVPGRSLHTSAAAMRRPEEWPSSTESGLQVCLLSWPRFSDEESRGLQIFGQIHAASPWVSSDIEAPVCRSALTSPPPAWARPQKGSRQNPA